MNNINIVGNLTKDVELKYTQNGKAVATGTVAVAKRFKKDEANFINVKVWGGQAEKYFAAYGKKGSKVAVSGEMFIDTWKDDKGQWQTNPYINADQVQLLDGKKEEATEGFQEVDSDDQIPF